ncbi:MAG: ankyrin repeat domain-containing protein [Bacillota bacterium]|nr:ankyrin repeat domain-containing protein [Bacillota bacterium]
MKIFNNIFSTKSKSIYKSIKKGNMSEIKEYFNETTNLNSNLEDMLFYAINNCGNNYFQTIEFLVNKGADINIHHGRFSETPLHRLCARVRPNIDVITMILDKGANVNSVNISGKTPVFYCNFSFSIELLNLLVKYGADINARDKYNNTLLHDDYIDLSDHNFEEFLKALISLGFDINSKNSYGLTPADFCRNEKIRGILMKYVTNE